MADQDLIAALDRVQEVDLTVTGRRSGRELTRPVWFVHEGQKLYLVPIDGTDSNWYKNVLRNPTVRVTAAGSALDALASPITDPARLRGVLDGLRAKYGADSVASYYPKPDAAVEIALD